MKLLNGFADPVDDAQRAFRLILKAMSEPGLPVTLNDGPDWQPLSPATSAVLLTLADNETPLYLSAPFRDDRIIHNLRFHTGAPLTDQASQAAFAVLDNAFPATLLDAFAGGSDESPHYSTTLILEAPSLSGAPPLTLSGPGIQQRRTFSVPLPEHVRHYLCRRPVAFPQGLDFIFTCGRQLLAVPRTTHVEES
ncbi:MULTISPECIES: phosphonate C-P lyase system protein PhnH [unclassified Brenneria]|uniref:phosphonate C-P lyase system protein PhnH n=1 Tax=unclassified Brenneria TaxID=2634434 RepID=UPI001552C0E3|nr:phosphonate C-P lyase system protein PhnH [Brenneria sp. hezel4-2-4]MEE3650584.1 phosphonate C-P lyase system protein PhnH [Brenneria sp. HEZEL_4_2_4]NPD00539.1 phosphonate C-P lyase system protein PhnH [Brenneria sp. hezel4-2-4]